MLDGGCSEQTCTFGVEVEKSGTEQLGDTGFQSLVLAVPVYLGEVWLGNTLTGTQLLSDMDFMQ